MRIAQQLYEGIEVKGEGTIGLITYLRTDSTRISDEAHKNLLDYIDENYGEGYKNEANIVGKKKKAVSKMPMRLLDHPMYTCHQM